MHKCTIHANINKGRGWRYTPIITKAVDSLLTCILVYRYIEIVTRKNQGASSKIR